MEEGETKKKSANKTAAKKKSANKANRISKEDSNLKSANPTNQVPIESLVLPKKTIPKIYNDSNFTKHPNYPTEDLLKVLIRSPKEAFVFWKFSKHSLDQIAKELKTPNTDGLTFRLKVEYQNVFGSDRVEWYELLPFTESYYLKFMFPVRMLECSIFVSFQEKEIPSLHTRGKDLPQGTESFRLDKEWIHPKWIEEGLVSQSSSGEYYFLEENPSGYYVNPRNQEVSPERKSDGNVSFQNASGSGKGILE
ncbi:hypothetical protein AB3N60_10730 [Leptospira sp. WS39.C2]